MRNNKVIMLNLLALLFMILTFTVHWIFIAGAAALSGYSWKLFYKK